MHELAIAESVVATVLERTGGRQVSVVRLRVGRLSGVVPDALTFCFELATAGTPLEGATLEIEEVQRPRALSLLRRGVRPRRRVPALRLRQRRRRGARRAASCR